MKWKLKLAEELQNADRYTEMTEAELLAEVGNRRLLSDNHDTVISIDWPHYCSTATEGCGGADGWCYTFAGHHASPAHSDKVAFVDHVATRCPDVFARSVATEVRTLVDKGRLPYANVRYSGSGEVHRKHLPALDLVIKAGVHLWGFTRNVSLAEQLVGIGAGALFSCDSTTPKKLIDAARSKGIKLAYTSLTVDDRPPDGTLVTFPVHKSGKVSEVVESESLCPKVVEEYFTGRRVPAACQVRCLRCHRP